MIDYINILSFGRYRAGHFNGRQLNYFDYSQHLSKHIDVECHLLIDNPGAFKTGYFDLFRDESLTKIRNVNRRVYNIIKPDFFNTPGDVLLCDFMVLLSLAHHNIRLKYNKIIVFDALETTVFFRKIPPPSGINPSIGDDSLMEYIKSYDNIVFLVTPYNIPDMEANGLKYKVYYKKINFGLFDSQYINRIQRKDEMCCCYYYYDRYNNGSLDKQSYLTYVTEKYPGIKTVNKFMDIWGYKSVLYTKKPYANNMEQFGRLVFELRYFGYDVIMDQSPDYIDKTGIDYYLEYYGKDIPNLVDEDTHGMLCQI